MTFALPAVFLRLNGFALGVTADEGERFIIDRVIRGQADLEESTGWLERSMDSR